MIEQMNESPMEHGDALQGSPVLEEVLGDALPKLTMFHVKLQQEGEPRGIIGPRDVDIIWERHILNSAAIVPFVRQATEHMRRKTVADIGSGGGFPGIVAAACLPDHQFTLIEPMERRVEWLRECIEMMDLDNVRIIRARAEEVIQAVRPQSNKNKRGAANKRSKRTNMHQRTDATNTGTQSMASLHGGMRQDSVTPSESASLVQTALPGQVAVGQVKPFAVVTCRAVAPMSKLAGWTLPLLCSHGSLVALKGKSAQAEIDKARQQITKLGGMNPRVVEALVAPGLEPTHVVIVDKR